MCNIVEEKEMYIFVVKENGWNKYQMLYVQEQIYCRNIYGIECR